MEKRTYVRMHGGVFARKATCVRTYVRTNVLHIKTSGWPMQRANFQDGIGHQVCGPCRMTSTRFAFRSGSSPLVAGGAVAPGLEPGPAEVSARDSPELPSSGSVALGAGLGARLGAGAAGAWRAAGG